MTSPHGEGAPWQRRALDCNDRLSGTIDIQTKRCRPATQGRTHTKGRRHPYDRNSHRIREIGRVIAARHGLALDTDDASIYLTPVAKALAEIVLLKGRPALSSEELADRLLIWTEVRAPRVPTSIIHEAAREAMDGWPRPETAEGLGRSLRLSYDERTALKITTIGSFDADKKERRKRYKARKRARDREQAKVRRAARGAKTRTENLSDTRPWEQLGISRRTWERRRAKGLTQNVVDPLSSPPTTSCDKRPAPCTGNGGLALRAEEGSGFASAGPPLAPAHHSGDGDWEGKEGGRSRLRPISSPALQPTHRQGACGVMHADDARRPRPPWRWDPRDILPDCIAFKAAHGRNPNSDECTTMFRAFYAANQSMGVAS